MKKVIARIKKERPDTVVQIGDLLDQYVFSNYSKKSAITPKLDFVKGLTEAKDMWATIRKLVPKAKCYQILGNHDIRISKRISERLPELAEVLSFVEEKYAFPGVKVMKSDRDFLTLDGVVYCHGWLSKSIDHAKHFNKPTVHGHDHRPGITADGNIWSMSVGYLADVNSIPLQYTASKFSRWRLGSGMVIDGVPNLFLL